MTIPLLSLTPWVDRGLDYSRKVAFCLSISENPKPRAYSFSDLSLAFVQNRSDECAGADHAQKGNEHEHGNHNDERISDSTETEGEVKERPTGEGGQEINQERESGPIEQTEGHQERARSRTLASERGRHDQRDRQSHGLAEPLDPRVH